MVSFFVIMVKVLIVNNMEGYGVYPSVNSILVADVVAVATTTAGITTGIASGIAT